jgi:hypothetical protein
MDSVYIGVLCERGSSKEFSGKFLMPPCLSQDLDLQLLCESGGIGFATGFSRTLAKTNPSGAAGDVVIVGVVVDEVTDQPLNTVSAMMPSVFTELDFATPLVLIGGSGPSVGKTTTTAALLKALSSNVICSAVKAAGTGCLEDSAAHLDSGAQYIVHSMDVGMPTTYLDPDTYQAGIREMLAYAADPNLVPDMLRLKHHRGHELAKPDVILAELGGDLSEANIPVLLSDDQLKKHVVAYIVCSESASSLAGALQELEETGIRNSPQTPIYAAMPWGNVEGMYSRMNGFVERGLIAGIFDIAKPDFGDDQRAWRINYTVHHKAIMSVSDLAQKIRQTFRASQKGHRLPEPNALPEQALLAG